MIRTLQEKPGILFSKKGKALETSSQKNSSKKKPSETRPLSQQEYLNDIIIKWSRTNEAKSLGVPQRLEYYKKALQDEVYHGDFRHSYSQIFYTLGKIESLDDHDLDSLAENVKILYEDIRKDDNCEGDFKSKILKLYDHVNLDVARINHMKGIDERSQSNREETLKDIRAAEKAAQEASKKADKANEKALLMQREYTTILGVFASIVITFAFAATFSTSILTNMDKVSMPKLVFVILILGGILINILVALYNFILSLNQREKLSLLRVNRTIAFLALSFFLLVLLLDGTFDPFMVLIFSTF